MRANNDWADATKPWKYKPYSYSNAITSWISRTITGAELVFTLSIFFLIAFCLGLGVAYWIMKDMIC